MPTLLQALVIKAESAGEHLAADVRTILIKAHEEFDALFARDEALVKKEETKIETDLNGAPKTEDSPAPPSTGVADTPPIVADENDVGNAAPAAPILVDAGTVTTPATVADTVESAPEVATTTEV